MKSLIILITAFSVYGCTNYAPQGINARNAAIALSACQPLGAEPRYIVSQAIDNGDYRISVACTEDIDVQFTVKNPSKKAEDI